MDSFSFEVEILMVTSFSSSEVNWMDFFVSWEGILRDSFSFSLEVSWTDSFSSLVVSEMDSSFVWEAS